ncbi:MAG: hypothetical protein LBE09_07325 [Christensenellaceae bacterium]|jgi:hypothetical protein|nr:hypothetical protein [Christensenellaceae bacterium]
MERQKTPTDTVTTPYNNYLFRVVLKSIFFVALMISVATYRGPNTSSVYQYGEFIVLAGVALFASLITLDPFLFTINYKIKKLSIISWGCVGVGVLLYVIFFSFYNSKIVVLFTCIIGCLFVAVSIVEYSIRILLKNELTYLKEYSDNIITAYKEYAIEKDANSESNYSVDISIIALIGYLLLFVSIRGGLSFIENYLAPTIIIMSIALLAVFVLQFLICKRIYGDTKKFIKRYIMFLQVTLITSISAVIATLLMPGNSLLQWLSTIMVAIGYSPLYLVSLRTSRYLNALRIAVLLTLLESDGSIKQEIPTQDEPN